MAGGEAERALALYEVFLAIYYRSRRPLRKRVLGME